MSLITNISQLRAASSINIGNTLSNWQPYLDEAEETFIRPVIGDDLFDELVTHLQSSGSGTSKMDNLLTKVHRALALYALYLGIDEMSVSISSSGVQVIESDSHKQAPQYKVLNLKETWLARAHRHVDLMLKYLDENKADFSSYIPQETDLFIQNANQFQHIIDIRESRRLFLTLRPVIRSIEKKYIRPTLSPDYFDELKSALTASSELSSDDQAVIDLIVPALAHLSMARALQDISVDILDWGVFETAANSFDSVKGKQAANRERVAMMIEANQRDGEAELKELQEYLDTNASESKFKTYFDSDRYIGAGKDPVTRSEFENKIDNAIFIA